MSIYFFHDIDADIATLSLREMCERFLADANTTDVQRLADLWDEEVVEYCAKVVEATLGDLLAAEYGLVSDDVEVLDDDLGQLQVRERGTVAFPEEIFNELIEAV